MSGNGAGDFKNLHAENNTNTETLVFGSMAAAHVQVDICFHRFPNVVNSSSQLDRRRLQIQFATLRIYRQTRHCEQSTAGRYEGLQI